MAPVDWSWGESYASPTLITPTHPTNDFNPHSNAFASPQNALGDFPQHWQNINNTHSTSVQPHQTHYKTSRKRSRDEMTEGYENDDSDSSRASTTPFPSARPTPSPPKRGYPAQPVLGSGMTLAYAYGDGDDMQMIGSQLDAASQTGTWAEELSERLRSSSMREQQQQQQQMQSQSQPRPGLESRKSMRLDREASNKEATDNAPSSASAIAIASMAVDGQGTTSTIDEASLTLGIGWSSIPSNTTMDAAARGWSRHIEAHFPLQNVRLVWMNKSLPAYLVSAVTNDTPERRPSPSPASELDSETMPDRPPSPWSNPPGSPGYYLFDEQFGQGRLVAKSWERALDNLRQAPIVFDGPSVMESSERVSSSGPPKPIQPQYWAGWGMRTGGLSALMADSSSGNPTSSTAALVEAAGGGGDSMDLDM